MEKKKRKEDCCIRLTSPKRVVWSEGQSQAESVNMRVFRSSYRKYLSAGEGSLFCFVYTAGMLCEMIAFFYLSRTQAVNIPALRPCSSAANNLSPETISRPSWLPDSILTLITYSEQSLYNERERKQDYPCRAQAKNAYYLIIYC